MDVQIRNEDLTIHQSNKQSIAAVPVPLLRPGRWQNYFRPSLH
jgi:hypothetical protein